MFTNKSYSVLQRDSIIEQLGDEKQLLSISPNAGNTKIRVLVIDDEENCLMATELYLENMGYTVSTVMGGIAGLKFIKSNYNNIDVILVDMMMPDLYGLDLVAELKSSPHLSNIPIILQTGVMDNKELTRAFDMGIVGILSKPYGKRELEAVFSKALNSLIANNA